MGRARQGRPNRLRLGVIAAWLGVIALSLDALVPIHLAFDLAEAFATVTPRAEAADHDPTRQLLALLIGHRDGDGHHGDTSDSHGRHHRDCPVCAAIGTLTGFAPAALVLLSAPLRIPAPAPLAAAAESAPRAGPAAAYRSRAPPIATADPTT
ncbi:MAG TPA: DUF2946 family protein [Stellaceae bacterium]|jgi:hypothetical protein